MKHLKGRFHKRREERLSQGRLEMLRTVGQGNIGHKRCLVKKPMPRQFGKVSVTGKAREASLAWSRLFRWSGQNPFNEFWNSVTSPFTATVRM